MTKVVSAPLLAEPYLLTGAGSIDCVFRWDEKAHAGHVDLGLGSPIEEQYTVVLESHIAGAFRVFIEQWRFWEGGINSFPLVPVPYVASPIPCSEAYRLKWVPVQYQNAPKEQFGLPYLKFTGNLWQIWLTGMRVPVLELGWEEQEKYLADFIARMDDLETLHVEANLAHPQAWQEALRVEERRTAQAAAFMEKFARKQAILSDITGQPKVFPRKLTKILKDTSSALPGVRPSLFFDAKIQHVFVEKETPSGIKNVRIAAVISPNWGTQVLRKHKAEYVKRLNQSLQPASMYAALFSNGSIGVSSDKEFLEKHYLGLFDLAKIAPKRHLSLYS